METLYYLLATQYQSLKMVSMQKILAFLSTSLTLTLSAPSSSAANPNPPNVEIYQPGVPFMPSSSSLPPPGAASHCDEIVTQFNTLGRTTVWNLVKKIHFEGDSGEPEGIVNVHEDRYIVSEGEYTESTTSFGEHVIINGTDRTPGAGFAHLVAYDGAGRRIANATLSHPGDLEYHLGGIDYDGESIWATLSQYRPNSTATVIKVDPTTLQKTDVLTADDHLGGIVRDVHTNELVTLNWGARNATLWDLGNLVPSSGGPPSSSLSSSSSSTPVTQTRNPSFYADYQDCKFLGHPARYAGRPVMICSGVTSLSALDATIGGLALVDMLTMVPLSEVPLTMESDLGVLITMNPFDVDVVNGRMRVYFMPDQHNSTLYVYEPEVNSPYQY